MTIQEIFNAKSTPEEKEKLLKELLNPKTNPFKVTEPMKAKMKSNLVGQNK